MEICIVPDAVAPPIPRAYTVSMIIRNFKGRRDVEVHLFRPVTQDTVLAEGAGYPWPQLLDDPLDPTEDFDRESTRRLIMEAFTASERDQVIEYLKDRYADKLTAINACAMDFPVPLGLSALSDLEEGKTAGFVHLDKTPNYPLGFPLRGFFDLAEHKPLIDVKDE